MLIWTQSSIIQFIVKQSTDFRYASIISRIFPDA